jgi:hypothetical protein
MEDGLENHFQRTEVGYAGSNMKYTFFAELCHALERKTSPKVHRQIIGWNYIEE